MNTRKLGVEIHITDLLLKRAGDACEEIYKEKQLTGTHGYILGYLANHTDRPVFQKDIENAFGIRRSSASNVLSLMERNGLIERLAVDSDARLKRIVMTDKGIALHADTVKAFQRISHRATQGIASEALDGFYAVLDAIQRNLSDDSHAD